MKLSHVFIEEYRSISRQSLDLGGLTVLFGANSSGKTNVLEAVEGILTGVEPRRHAKFGTDFGDEEPATGRYVAELDYLAVPGHPDQRRLLELLGNRDEASYARVLPPPDRQLVEIASFDEARSLLAEALVQSGNCGDEDDRRLIADAMVRSGVIMKDEDLWLVAIGEDLDPAVIEAAERVADALADAGQDTTDDHLAISCAQLTADGFCYVETLGESPGLVRTEWLATDPERVTEEVEQDLGSIEIVPMLTGGGVTDALRAIAGAGTWLETQAPAGNEGPSNMSEAFAGTSRDWMRVRPALHAVADLLSRRATDLLPTFLRDQGRVVCSITPPILWGREPRVQIAFEEHDGTVVPLEVIGAGSRRWAVASVRRAAADLRDARWRLRSSGSVLDDGADSDPLAELVDELRTSNAALSDAEAESQLREISTAAEMLELVEPDWPKRVDDVLLVDEPEANLHPAATESVIDWLRQAGSTYGAVIVATHDRRFLELTPDEADLVYVERRNGKTELRPLGEAGIHALDGVAEEMGLRRADLLQLQRMVLFVEGVHDQAVLEAYVGDVLRRERVLVLPMHGTHNAMP